MPVIYSHAISGRAILNSDDSHWDDPLTLTMLIDIFSERGYHAVIGQHTQEIPTRFNLETGEITTRSRKVYTFRIHFKGSEIRRG